MCLKKFKSDYDGKTYRFSMKQLLIVRKNSTTIKMLDEINKNAPTFLHQGCVEEVRKTVYTAKDLNKITPNKLYKELLDEHLEYYRECILNSVKNAVAFRDYIEKVENIPHTNEQKIKNLDKVDCHLFWAIENYYIEHNLIDEPIEPYINLIISNPLYRSSDIIQIPLSNIVSEYRPKQVLGLHRSVTARIEEISQPRGGYVPVKNFTLFYEQDNFSLNPTENIHPSIVGLCVDYLSRYLLEKEKAAFAISFKGAEILNLESKADALFAKINGLDDESIISAVKLCGFDVAFRVGPSRYVDVNTINPDKNTIENIKIMVERSMNFFKKYGPVTKFGFTFEKDGYTDVVSSGDGDFLTSDTLWDFKTSTKDITSKHTLQLLMYYIMGKHSKQEIYKNIKYIGVFNPRKNIVLKLDVASIALSIISETEEKIICYKK